MSKNIVPATVLSAASGAVAVLIQGIWSVALQALINQTMWEQNDFADSVRFTFNNSAWSGWMVLAIFGASLGISTLLAWSASYKREFLRAEKICVLVGGSFLTFFLVQAAKTLISYPPAPKAAAEKAFLYAKFTTLTANVATLQMLWVILLVCYGLKVRLIKLEFDFPESIDRSLAFESLARSEREDAAMSPEELVLKHLNRR